MIDLHLRAADEAAMAAALPFARITDVDGQPCWITATHDYALDVIGALALSPGQYDPETGAEISPPVMAEGWHLNLRCTPEIVALVPEEIIVTPTNPRRSFSD